MSWVKALDFSTLKKSGREVVKVGGRQILLVYSQQHIYALNNRCPHEGYPLKVGTLTSGCVLTCNWHNWKFDLSTGETLVGGDSLRCYATEVRDGSVWIELQEIPHRERIGKAIQNLRSAFDDYQYDRLARELARLQQAGADDSLSIEHALQWASERYQYGMTHAQAVTADWLWLRHARRRNKTQRLVSTLEPVAHLSWDVLRQPRFPYPEDRREFSSSGLSRAIEDEDERGAIGMVRSALESSDGFESLDEPLCRAALAHYQDFGHSAIYVEKTRYLVEQYGADHAIHTVLPLVRSLVYARREDLIPEFRHYAAALANWNKHENRQLSPKNFRGLTVRQALTLTAKTGGEPEHLYHVLLGAAAWNLLHYDISLQDRTDGSIRDNVGWLYFTHAITFANAVRTICERHPDLWPAGLLQMSCFVGRAARYVDSDDHESRWNVADVDSFMSGTLDHLFNLDYGEHIVACHYVKTAVAVYREIEAHPDAPWVGILAAALNRLVNSPLRRRSPLRTARQMLRFVGSEG